MPKTEILELLRDIERELVDLADTLHSDMHEIDYMPCLEQISQNCELIADMVISSS